MKDHYYAVIMAGGGGTRLWPVSRRGSPKQTLKLFDDRSLFQLAIDRLEGFLPLEHIFVVTSAEQVERLHDQKPELNLSNFLVEPQPRGTAAVVAMAAAALRKIDADAVLAVLTADHLIGNVEEFHRSLTAADELAKQGYIVTMGIKPSHPATGYGYIESGEELGEFAGVRGYKVVNFIEKPDGDRARELIKKDTFTWNSGMFISRADVILGEYKKLMPLLSLRINSILPYLNRDHLHPGFTEVWLKIKPETVDYGIMEKTSLAVVLPVMNLEWNDVGSWDSFFDVFAVNENGNIILQAKHEGIDTTNSLVLSTDPDKLVVTLGMSNVIVIQTQDAVLICPRGESQRVKELVNYLEKNHYTLFL